MTPARSQARMARLSVGKVWRQSCPFLRLRLAPAPMIDRIEEHRQGYFVPDVRFAPL
jgi:hypothetical protein